MDTPVAIGQQSRPFPPWMPTDAPQQPGTPPKQLPVPPPKLPVKAAPGTPPVWWAARYRSTAVLQAAAAVLQAAAAAAAGSSSSSTAQETIKAHEGSSSCREGRSRLEGKGGLRAEPVRLLGTP